MIEPLEQKLTEDCEHDFVTKFGETYCQECGMSEVDFIHNNEAAPKKLITAFVREHFDRLMNEEISFSRFVEILNEEVDLIKRRKK